MASKLWAELIECIKELEQDIPRLDSKRKAQASKRVRLKIYKTIRLLRAINGLANIA